MMACRYAPAPDQFASGLLSYLDCQAATLGAQGYGALAAPGSTASLLLLAFLTIFIAMFGYRLLLGDTPGLREGVLVFVKIGIVLALATGWPAYQTLIYDVVLRAPGELAAEIGGASGLPGATGGLAARLDGVDRGLRTLSIYGVGVPVIEPGTQVQAIEPSLWSGFDTFALGASRIVFLGTAVGGFALVRLAAGSLLALGPLFIAFLLFPGTRGLFEGWLRALIGSALGAFAITILLGIELAMLEPWLADLVGRRAGGEAITGVPATLLAATLIFAGVSIGLTGVAAKVASGFRLPASIASSLFLRHSALSGETVSLTPPVPVIPNLTGGVPEGRSRAADVADAVATMQRREEQYRSSATSISDITPALPGSAGGSGGSTSHGTVPIGQRFRRRTTSRISVSSRLRDRRA